MFSDLHQHKDHHRENVTLLPQKSEGLSNKVRSGVSRVRKARKIKTNFFSSSVTTPLLNAMKSTLKLFQNPFRKTTNKKILRKSEAKVKQIAKPNVKNKSVNQKVLKKRPTKKVTLKKGKPPLRKSTQPQQKRLTLKKQISNRLPAKQLSSKQTKQQLQVKSNNLQKHHHRNSKPKPQQIIQNTKHKPELSHSRPITPIRFSKPSKVESKNHQIKTSHTRRGNNQHPQQHETRSNNQKKTTQALQKKQNKQPLAHLTKKQNVQSKEKKPIFSTNPTPGQPFELTKANKTVVKQLIVELHDKIHDVLKHQNIPNQNKSLSAVINTGNRNSQIAKNEKNPIVNSFNNNLNKKHFQSQKIASAVRDIKSFMKTSKNILNTQTNFINKPVIQNTQTSFKQQKSEQSRFEPFIPKFEAIENQTPDTKKLHKRPYIPITSSTEEQNHFENENRGEHKISKPAEHNPNHINFPDIILTETPTKKSEHLRPVKEKLVDRAVTNNVHSSDLIIRKSDIFSRLGNKKFESGPRSMEDCNHLVSDCYEKLLDRKIVELQNQMQMLEMKYWGNKV